MAADYSFNFWWSVSCYRLLAFLPYMGILFGIKIKESSRQVVESVGSLSFFILFLYLCHEKILYASLSLQEIQDHFRAGLFSHGTVDGQVVIAQISPGAPCDGLVVIGPGRV